MNKQNKATCINEDNKDRRFTLIIYLNYIYMQIYFTQDKEIYLSKQQNKIVSIFMEVSMLSQP